MVFTTISQLSAGLPRELFCRRTPLQPVMETSCRQPKRRGLIISIKNYKPEVGTPLRWVHDDANEMRELLCGSSLGFQLDDVTVMIDLPGVADHLQPTCSNITRQLELFLKEQRPGDIFFFMYVGHAFHQLNYDGTEEDHQDEYLISLDGGKILDDILYSFLVKPLLPGSKLIAVMDTCHSGTLLDLPHHRCNRVSNWTSSARRTIRSGLERLPSWLFRGDGPAVPPTISSHGEAIRLFGLPLPRWATSVKHPVKFCSGFCRRRPLRETEEPFALCFSACKDPQKTYEGPYEGQSMSRAFVRTLSMPRTRNPCSST
ncbi:peptidase C14, caspase domain-containing protein [Infundibulicybe gibba]|nr:peptidase C14, caspase domain-containing protein [Infundibulicybe gibba]